MHSNRLGKNGPEIPRVGYGAMVLEGFYGDVNRQQAVDTLKHVISKGLMIDTADAYGGGSNELLISEAIKAAGDQSFLASKFGIVFDEIFSGTPVQTGWGFALNINNTESYFRHCLETSLKNLGVSKIDLYYAHYIDPNVPIDQTVSFMAKAMDEGLIGAIGLSNATAEEIKRAGEVAPIAAVQYEYSMWRREVEKEILPLTEKMGTSLVAWSPLGGGLLAGQLTELESKDFRNNNPRYSGKNLQTNIERFGPLKEIASGLGITCAQLALTWILHQADNIFVIPGTRSIDRVDENLQSLDFKLDPDLLGELDKILTDEFAVGGTLL